MKDNVQLAGHLQDVVRGLGDVEHAVRTAPQPQIDLPANVVVVNVPGPMQREEKAAEPAPPPIVNVTVPVPVVHVAAPVVEIAVPPAPAQRWRVTVTSRDDQGLIEEFLIEPIAS